MTKSLNFPYVFIVTGDLPGYTMHQNQNCKYNQIGPMMTGGSVQDCATKCESEDQCEGFCMCGNDCRVKSVCEVASMTSSYCSCFTPSEYVLRLSYVIFYAFTY
jgi:hypothetical protein